VKQDQHTRWSQLESLLERPRRGRRRLTAPEATDLARLYRETASDLATARRKEPEATITRYLEDLVLRTHSRLYQPPRGNLAGLWAFFRHRMPALTAQYRRAVLLAAGFMLLGVIIGYVAVTWDPNLADALVPQQLREEVAKPLTGELASMGTSPLLSTQIMLNNIRVGVLAFGLGLTFGVGTAYVLAYNGVMLGALAAVYHRAHLDIAFWATILPHGVIELTAIALSGAAGFTMALALIRPGTLPRRQSLFRSGPDALGLALGTIPMYMVAGLIEGFVTPRGISHWGKLAVAALTVVPTALYLVRFHRRRSREGRAA